jgi:hypothetical protein
LVANDAMKRWPMEKQSEWASGARGEEIGERDGEVKWNRLRKGVLNEWRDGMSKRRSGEEM